MTAVDCESQPVCASVMQVYAASQTCINVQIKGIWFHFEEYVLWDIYNAQTQGQIWTQAQTTEALMSPYVSRWNGFNVELYDVDNFKWFQCKTALDLTVYSPSVFIWMWACV